MPTAATVNWTLTGLQSLTRCGGLEVSLDLARPAAGLTISAETSPRSVDHLLGLDLAANCPPSDHWLRGPDITAVYEPADPRQLSATAMWRQHACDATIAARDAVATWELIASAQTSLLDSEPAVSVIADVAADEVRWLAAAAQADDWSSLTPATTLPAQATAVLALRSTGSAVLLAPHPDDEPRLDATWEQGRLRLVWRLFTRHLEKGVLLRSRVLAACGPAADTTWTARLLADFHAAPPPLST
jgi:hypothetical protein